MNMRVYLLLLTAWIVGCASKTAPSAAFAPAPGAEYEESYDSFAAGDALGAAESAPASRAISRRGARKEAAASPAAPPPPAEIRPSEPPPPTARMVHYDGWARMRVTKPAEALDEVAQLAEQAGGRVDRLSTSNVTVRVPVERFSEVWDKVKMLGDILDQRVRADDVTEQFLAVDLRTKTLKTMQDRLVRLLGRAKSEEEKLALLEQITRVTEELDATESRLRTLKDLAAMSTISVEAVPREAFGSTSGSAALAGFEWIRGLSPFNRSVWDSDKRLELEPPHEMVVLSKTGPFIAESADGTLLWTMRVENDPEGSNKFWIRAIRDQIGAEFDDVETKTLGEYECLMLREPGADEPYRWDVCVSERGRWLEVAQAYYPSPVQVVRFAERVSFCLDHEGGAS